ncbi:MAG: hypothetical protein P1R58_00710, partial [bacterium]|nr:hypothetical protein [bacterium]
YTEDKAAMFLTAGVGNYGGWSDMGFFAGFSYRTMVSPKVGIFVQPRFHMVMSDPGVNLIQVIVGAQMPLGNK